MKEIYRQCAVFVRRGGKWKQWGKESSFISQAELDCINLQSEHGKENVKIMKRRVTVDFGEWEDFQAWKDL